VIEEKVPKDFNEILDGIYILKQDKDTTWMDAILEFCETNSYRIEDVGFMLKENRNFLKILEEDFKRTNFMRGFIKDLSTQIEEWS
jgi:hypothetical protein